MNSSLHDLFASLDLQTVVLTPNQRLSAYLKKNFACFRSEQNEKAWISPDFFPLTTWMLTRWMVLEDAGCVTKLLLSSDQEKVVWQDIIESYYPESQQYNASFLAQSAFDAWRLLCGWNVSPEDPQFSQNDNTAFFARWALEFNQRCEIHGFASEAKLPEYLKKHFRQKDYPRKLVLFEFDEVSPQLNSFLDFLKGQQIVVLHFSSARDPVLPRKICFADQTIEIEAALSFAFSHHLENKNQSIAIVVPDLSERWQAIKSMVHGAWHDSATLMPSVSYSISGGKALLDYPIIRTSVLLIKSVFGTLSLDELFELIRSPFWKMGEINISQIDYLTWELAKTKQENWSLEAFFEKFPEVLSLINTCIGKNISPFKLDSLKACAEHNNFKNWILTVQDLLKVLGWPGKRTLNSEEYQTVVRLNSLWVELAKLDLVTFREIHFDDFYKSWVRLLQETLFQPKSEEASIQILGVLEAAGQFFDKIWVVGFTQDAWPSKPTPHPFIPLGLQRKLNFPHASSERETTYAKKVLQNFCCQTNELVMSWPAFLADRPLLPSSLIANTPTLSPEDLPSVSQDSAGRAIYQQYSKQVELFKDWQAPEINEFQLAGGSAVLKNFHECPFRAYAKHRLLAKTPLPREFNLSLQERGVILHKILELISGFLPDSDTLLSHSEIPSVIHKSVESALSLFKPVFYQRPAYYLLEKEYFCNLMMNWIALESKREPFITIASEEKQTVSLGGVSLNIRMDRVDLLQNGQWLIIDYKSQAPSLRNWFGEKPQDPQLPLYAILHADKVCAMAFVEINSKGIRWSGLSNTDELIGDLKGFEDYKDKDDMTWDQQLAHWRELLEKSLRTYRSGHAEPAPFSAVTCERCDYMSLCRYYTDRD